MSRYYKILSLALLMALTLAFAAMAAPDKDRYLELFGKRAAYSLEYKYTMMMDKEILGSAVVLVKGEKLYSANNTGGMISYMINDGKFMYMWSSMSNIGQKYDLSEPSKNQELTKEDILDADVQVKLLGKETVNGYLCEKAEIKVEGEVQYHWISEKYGIIIRTIVENMQMDVTDIVEKNIPDSTFIPPANIDFSGNPFAFLGKSVAEAANAAVQEAAKAVEQAIEENKPVDEAGFLSILAKRGSIPVVYTEKYDNLLNSKVSVSVKGGKEYRSVDAAIKLYMMYDGKDIYTWNSLIKTVSKVKPDDTLLKVLSPYDPTIVYATDFDSYEYIGRAEISGEQCRWARVFYKGRSYELWVSERLGILMRIKVGDVDMTVGLFYEQDVPDTSFQLPSGYKVK